MTFPRVRCRVISEGCLQDDMLRYHIEGLACAISDAICAAAAVEGAHPGARRAATPRSAPVQRIRARGAQKRYDFSVDWINDQLVHGLPSTHDGASSSSAGRPKQLSAFGDGFGEQALDGLGEQAGWQSRGHQPFESAALIPALYE
ncbi:unnamed protein product, partial [Prorocentrum cordatum]